MVNIFICKILDNFLQLLFIKIYHKSFGKHFCMLNLRQICFFLSENFTHSLYFMQVLTLLGRHSFVLYNIYIIMNIVFISITTCNLEFSSSSKPETHSARILLETFRLIGMEPWRAILLSA